MTYKTVRHYREIGRRGSTVDTGLTLEQAQAACRKPESSTTEWFLGFTAERTPAEQKAFLARDVEHTRTAFSAMLGSGLVGKPTGAYQDLST